MNTVILDLLLRQDEWTPEETRAWQQALAEDPALAQQVAEWQTLAAQVRQSWQTHLPNRDALVLHALAEAGRTDLLTSVEIAEAQAVQSQIEKTRALHPALDDIVGDIQQAATDFEAIWDAEVNAKQAPRMTRITPLRRQPALMWASRIAAVLVVGLVAFWFIQQNNSPTWVTYETGANEMRQIDLPDGSHVRLLPYSTFSFTRDEDTRRARLTGRAYFDVVHDPAAAFLVETESAMTRVLGTSFGVQASLAATQVTLTEGKVQLQIKAAETDVTLEPGEMVHVAKDGSFDAPKSVNLADALEWTDLFIFNQAPLVEIADHLAAHYQITITVDPTLTQERITYEGERSDALADILDALSITLGASVAREADGTYRIIA